MTIQPGLTMTKTFTVESQHTASHIGSGTVQVLATPTMISFMEITARELLDQHLDDAHTTVGTRVDVRHLAPTGLGKQVAVRAEVLEVNEPRVVLKVEAQEGDKLVGTGTHWRYIINVEAFSQQLDS